MVEQFTFLQEHIEQLNLLDLLYNYQLITDEEYGLISEIKKSYKHCKSFSFIASYNYVRTRGGKSREEMVDIVDSRRQYLRFEKCTKEIEDTLLIDKQAIYFLQKLGENEFYNLVLDLCVVVDRIHGIFYGTTFDNKIKKLVNSIKEYGLRRTSKESKISYDIIRHVIKNGRDCKYYILEKLFNFFNIL